MQTRPPTLFQILYATVALVLAALHSGCTARQDPALTPASASPGAPDAAAQRKANLAKLNDEDRALAEAQGYCAVAGQPLGSMGMPLKVMLNNQPVFLCCKGCESEAKADPEKTLAKVAELKAKTQAETTP